MREFWLYLQAVISNWFTGFWFLTAVPEALSYMLPEAWFGGISTWLDERIEEDNRRKIYRVIALAGLLIASFYAWDEQYKIAMSKSPEEITKTINGLQAQIDDLRQYKKNHEAGEWPALNPTEQKDWSNALSPFAGKVTAVEIYETDVRSEFLSDSLIKMFKGAKFPEPRVYRGAGLPDGILVTGSPTEVVNVVGNLLSGS